MTTMKIWRLVLATLAAFSLASCSSESKDGDWDPMVWKAEVPVQTTDKVYNVSEDGETIVFSCLNYSRPWFSKAEVDGEPKFASTVWQYTCQVKYSLYSVSDDLLRFYDITAEYLGIDGKQHTEVISDKSWSYIPEPIGFADIPEDFKCKIAAVRKSELPELTADYYEIGYGVDVHVNFLTADGKLVSNIKHTMPDTFTFETDKTGMQKFPCCAVEQQYDRNAVTSK